ncbi:MAG: hypothetical protein JW781_08100 [Deltaproteobacteria bacterium]|nr:hypothetical protein [Candidatus Anaeroferrophillacea bacterium]
MKLTALGLALLIIGGLVAGCATSNGSFNRGSMWVTVSPEMRDELKTEEELLARFNQYWSGYASGDVSQTFALEAPYIREMVTPDKYRLYLNLMTRKSTLKAVEIVAVHRPNDFIREVECRLILETATGEPRQRETRDRWVLATGGWYHTFTNPLLFPELN